MMMRGRCFHSCRFLLEVRHYVQNVPKTLLHCFGKKAFSSNRGDKFPPREPSEYEELYDDLYGSPVMNDNTQGFSSFFDKLNNKKGLVSPLPKQLFVLFHKNNRIELF